MFLFEKPNDAIAIIPVTQADLPDAVATLRSPLAEQWIKTQNFKATPGQYCAIPKLNGDLDCVLTGYDAKASSRWHLAHLPKALSVRNYFLQCEWSESEQLDAAIGWGLAMHQCPKQWNDAQAHPRQEGSHLYVEGLTEQMQSWVDAFQWGRHLINQPANHLNTESLSNEMKQLCQKLNATFREYKGQELLNDFPAVHAVGRASAYEPRLLEMQHGESTWPLLTLVGKGVCFDSGGLDLKPSPYMRQMKKDMGGAAHVLVLARWIIEQQWPVRLHVLIPAVENAVSANAFRPGDVLTMRNGSTVEIDNTDAEGRLILAEALTYACEKQPDLIIDFATLTGAARVALGTEIPVFFSNQACMIQNMQQASEQAKELIWPLPLHHDYDHELMSDCADVQNAGGRYGGAITAALFLHRFITNETPWLHFDVMAYNLRHRPGRPKGGELMGLFAVINYLERFFLKKRQ